MGSSVGLNYMEASLARVDCLVENAPTEEHTVLWFWVANRRAAHAGSLVGGQETPAGGSCGLQSRSCGVRAPGSLRGVEALVRSDA